MVRCSVLLWLLAVALAATVLLRDDWSRAANSGGTTSKDSVYFGRSLFAAQEEVIHLGGALTFTADGVSREAVKTAVQEAVAKALNLRRSAVKVKVGEHAYRLRRLRDYWAPTFTAAVSRGRFEDLEDTAMTIAADLGSFARLLKGVLDTEADDEVAFQKSFEVTSFSPLVELPGGGASQDATASNNADGEGDDYSEMSDEKGDDDRSDEGEGSEEAGGDKGLDEEDEDEGSDKEGEDEKADEEGEKTSTSTTVSSSTSSVSSSSTSTTVSSSTSSVSSTSTSTTVSSSTASMSTTSSVSSSKTLKTHGKGTSARTHTGTRMSTSTKTPRTRTSTTQTVTTTSSSATEAVTHTIPARPPTSMSVLEGPTGTPTSTMPWTQVVAISQCEGNTPNWTNGFGQDCDFYRDRFLCSNGDAKHQWQMGPFYNYPERNCCACGKLRTTTTTTMFPPGARYFGEGEVYLTGDVIFAVDGASEERALMSAALAMSILLRVNATAIEMTLLRDALPERRLSDTWHLTYRIDTPQKEVDAVHRRADQIEEDPSEFAAVLRDTLVAEGAPLSLVQETFLVVEFSMERDSIPVVFRTPAPSMSVRAWEIVMTVSTNPVEAALLIFIGFSTFASCYYFIKRRIWLSRARAKGKSAARKGYDALPTEPGGKNGDQVIEVPSFGVFVCCDKALRLW
eukprot:TRINITY_DN12633_c0_g1_i2.p1 TRINITY_DN12633_c0_g1~~TRINITY_DN12633_c0_g1_i2.p1  ORF type:complete len:681 (-),score=85.27 TRINITY_DN12633_c0_g1_i2:77-2119(-)